MAYDGMTPLQPALAELLGLSVKSQAHLAKLVKEAKANLGITSTARILPLGQRLAIYQWHKDRLNFVQNIKQGEATHTGQQPDNTVYNVKQDCELLTDDGDNNSDDFGQIHFAIQIDKKRTTVMLEGYLIKATQRKHGLTGNGDIRAWIERAIKTDGGRFDSHAPLTRQVKRLIVESFI